MGFSLKREFCYLLEIKETKKNFILKIMLYLYQGEQTLYNILCKYYKIIF